MKKYYTSDELAEGIDGLPKISKSTQRNLRFRRKLKYTTCARKCLYTREWVEDYLNSNIVETKKNQKGSKNE